MLKTILTTLMLAVAGNVGELISSNVALGSAVALSSTIPSNVTSVSLTAGDWGCTGWVGFSENGSTTSTSNSASLSTTTGTMATPPNGGGYANLPASLPAGAGAVLSMPPTRFSLASTTTLFLVAVSTFAVSTNSAYGFLGCRRVR